MKNPREFGIVTSKERIYIMKILTCTITALAFFLIGTFTGSILTSTPQTETKNPAAYSVQREGNVEYHTYLPRLNNE